MSLVNAFKRLVSGKKPLASDVNQLIDALSGNADIGPLSLFAPIANPSAPTVAVNTTAGVLNGNYQYIQVNVTGWIGSDNQMYVQGFAPSAVSAVVAPANQQVNVTLTVGPAGTIARALYRPVAGGTAYKFVQWFDDNTTTAWTDNVADANLGTGMPTVNGTAIPAAVPASNTTGTAFNLPVTIGQNPNLLLNPSWRQGSTGWNGVWSNGFATTFGTQGEGGYLYNSLNQSPTAIQVDNSSNLIPASPNATFTLSGEMNATGVTSGSIGLQIAALDSSSNVLTSSVVNATSGTGWGKYTVPSFTTPANTAYLRVASQMSANTSVTSSGTPTTVATLLSDPLTEYTGSTAAPWTVQSGSFTFSSSGATSGANSSIMTAGNAAWKPLTGTNGSTLAITEQATFTTPATLSTGDNGYIRLHQDVNNAYYAYINNNTFILAKVVAGVVTALATVSQAIAASTTYTLTLSFDSNGNLTAKLYSGTGTGGTLLQTLTPSGGKDTSLTGGFLIGVGGDTGVVIKSALVTGPFGQSGCGWRKLKLEQGSVATTFSDDNSIVTPSNQVFTSSGTFTVPAGVSRVFVQCWGAGGGGAGYSTGGGSFGASGGGYAEGWVPVSSGQQITVTVGAPGTGGIGNASGTAGQNSSFGSYVTGYGGNAGPANISNGPNGVSGSGSVAVSSSNVTTTNGTNGATGFGGAGGTGGTSPTAGSAPGGGGGAQSGASGNGANGARGEVRVAY